MVAQQAQALRALLVLGALAAGCAMGPRADAGRVARLGAIMSAEPLTRGLPLEKAALAFAPGLGRGTLTGSTITLDRDASDRELAAQLAHLLVHARDQLGDGCAQGLAAAERSEQEAAALEASLRRRLGLAAISDPEQAIADYRRRCAPSRSRLEVRDAF